MQDHFNHVNLEELPSEHNLKDDKKFNSLPFLLYKFWLIVNFALAFVAECALILAFRKNMEEKPILSQMSYLMMMISYFLIFYASAEMLFAIFRRKLRAAQRSFLKFQYLLIGLTLFLSLLPKPQDFIRLLIFLFVLFLPIIHLLRGYAVLRVFKKYRNFEISEISNPLVSDSFDQNEEIASELAESEQQFKSCLYLAYNWFLKFAVVFEVFVIFTCICSFIMMPSYIVDSSIELYHEIGSFLLSSFNADSRFEMENAMQTTNLTRSKRAVILLMISLVTSIICYLFIANRAERYEMDNLPIPTFKWFLLFFAIPVLCLLGAIKFHKLIEKRSSLMKFNGETYL